MQNDKRIALRIDNDMLKKLQQLSKKEKRSLSNIVRWIISKFIGGK